MCAGGSSPREQFYHLRQRAAGRLRHAGLARRAAVVQRQCRHVRRVVRRVDAVAGGDQRPPGAQGDRPERHRHRLPRRLGVSGRRLRTQFQPLVDDVACSRSTPCSASARKIPPRRRPFRRLLDGADNLPEEFTRLPLAGHPILAEFAPYYDDWVNHPTYDDFWAGLDVSTRYDTLDVAAFNIGGWYDIFLQGHNRELHRHAREGPGSGARPAASAARPVESRRHARAATRLARTTSACAPPAA